MTRNFVLVDVQAACLPQSLTILQAEGTLTPDYVECRKQIIEEARSVINYSICSVLQTSEAEDSHRFQKLLLETEARLKDEP